MLSDSSGRWFVCGEKDVSELVRESATAYRGSVMFDALRLTWEPVRLESGAVVETGEKIVPDLSAVSAIGFVFDETNPGAPVQFTAISLRGGAKAEATLQPGSVTHRLVDGLGQEDFAFWRGGSAVRNMTVPPGRNIRRVLFGNKDGSGSALQETFIGRGVVLESALNTTNLEEPVAGFLLNRMVDYLVDYQPAETAANLVVVGEGPFQTWVNALGASVQSDLSASAIAAVDAQNASALAGAKSDLMAHLEQGGTVWFSDVTPDTVDLVREISGKPLRLTEPFFGQRFCCIKAPVSWARVGSPHEWVDYYDGILAPYPFEPNFSPLLAGIANLDLDWKGTPMFRQGIEIEGMNPVSASADHQILISNWHIGSEGTDHLYGENLNGVRDLRQSSWFVNRDPVVLELAVGKGRVIISQLDLTAGGDKAKRFMQTLLTNLGVSFDGAMPVPAEVVYSSELRNDQLARFAVYDTQIDPVQRQFYGVPNPMPDYHKETRIGVMATEEAELPLMGFFGDSLTLGLFNPLAEKLEGVVRMDEPILLHRSRSAGGILQNKIGDATYARVVFSIGEVDAGVETTDAEFRSHLEAILKVLSEHSQKVYWVPAPSAYGNSANAARARELNQIAAEFFDGKDVYMLPFVYADQTDLPSGYFSGFSKKFQPEEAKVLAERLGQGIISFGAQ